MSSILGEHVPYVPLVPSDPPTVTSHQPDVFMPQGLSVQLNCSFDGLPVPTITWTLPNRSVLTSSQGRFILQSTSTFTSLTISSLVGGGDSGTYTCTASNLRGVASSSVHLTVQGEMWACPGGQILPWQQALYLAHVWCTLVPWLSYMMQ